MQQKNASPTRAQSRILESRGMNSRIWCVMKDLRKRLIVRNRISGEVKVICK